MAGVRCFGCGVEFSFFKREHSCKNCHRIFCSQCTSKSAVIPSQGTKAVRVYDQCYKILTGKVEKSANIQPDGKLNDLDKSSEQTYTSEYQERSKDKRFVSSIGRNIPLNNVGNENVNPDPDEELRERLSNLRDDASRPKPTTDKELGERFSNLTGRTATCMQKSDINTPRPKKTETEQTDDLLKQMMAEHQIDDSASSSSGVTNEEIEERLARLKGMDPEVFKNSQVSWDSDEDEETQMNRYLKQVFAEAKLEEKTESMEIGDISLKKKPLSKTGKAKLDSKIANLPKGSEKASSIFNKDYEADSDDDELPWCCICNANAALRCHGCDDDLYCKRCYREGHDREDFEDHQITPYKPKKRR